MGQLQAPGDGPLVPVKSKLRHFLTGKPRTFEFLENFCSNPPSPGQKAVQMPHQRSISGDQMLSSPPGKPDYCLNELFSNYYYASEAVYVNMV